jgi:F-type H+-transporting ATPase subunit b
MTQLVPLMLFAAEGEGPVSPFEVNFGLFFWTWLVFIALFLLLKKYAWPAIVKATEERERAIARQLEEAESLNTESAARLAEQEKLLGEARSQAQQLVADARSVADQERTAALEKTKQEQEALLARAKREIATEREKAIRALREEAVDLSLAAASKLIEQRLDSASDRELVLGYLGSLEEKH